MKSDNDKNFDKSSFDDLECPLCSQLRKPHEVVLTQDKSDLKYVSYKCPADHEYHGQDYIWKIMADGSLVD